MIASSLPQTIFDQLYEYAVQLIEKGKAYVDDLSAAEIREYRGTLTEPGVDSPYRNRAIEENLDLFERMKAGEFPDGISYVASQDRYGFIEYFPYEIRCFIAS